MLKSWTTTEVREMARLFEPIHPGEILREEFLKPMGISVNRLARDIVVPPGRISEIVNGKRGITADTALRPARFFGTSPNRDITRWRLPRLSGTTRHLSIRESDYPTSPAARQRCGPWHR